MDLETYRRILANAKATRMDWRVFDNGYLLLSKGNSATLYNDKAEVFVCGNIKNVVPLPDGFTAVLKTEKKVLKWTIYRPNGEVFAQFGKEVTFLPNGLAYYETKRLETILFFPLTEAEDINLGCGIVDVCGAGNVVLYGQLVRRSTFYHLCRIENGKIIDKRSFNNICRPFFFENGNFAAFDSSNNWFNGSGMFRVYNRFGQQIFAANVDYALFKAKVGRNHFFVNNGKRYKGVYSAETGKLVLAENDVNTFLDNGAYVSGKGLILSDGNGKIDAPIYRVKQLGKSGVIFMYKGYIFVIDTDRHLSELYNDVQYALERSLKKCPSDADYSADYPDYLLELSTILH